jgi:hypothetical protein
MEKIDRSWQIFASKEKEIAVLAEVTIRERKSWVILCIV